MRSGSPLNVSRAPTDLAWPLDRSSVSRPAVSISSTSEMSMRISSFGRVMWNSVPSRWWAELSSRSPRTVIVRSWPLRVALRPNVWDRAPFEASLVVMCPSIRFGYDIGSPAA